MIILAEMMNEQRILSYEEAEQMMRDAQPDKVVKSGLPDSTRPSEPDNETDVDDVIRRATENDPQLTEINCNNMKVTPLQCTAAFVILLLQRRTVSQGKIFDL